jgi:hypothetical protein
VVSKSELWVVELRCFFWGVVLGIISTIVALGLGHVLE